MPNALTWLFLAALLAASATRLWLALRQIRHVRAHRDAVPPSFAGSIPLHAHQKAADYTAAKTRFGAVDTLVGALLVLLLTLGGGLELLSRAWAHAFAPGSLAHGAALLLSALFVQAIVSLPLALYRTFVIESRFGFNRMTLRLFFVDLVKQTLLALALGIPLLLAVLWLMARMGEHWWLYVWLLITAFGNAFLAGIGATKRIVLFDTLIDRLDPSEVEAVLAHELGHYKLHHVVKMVALSAAMSLAGLWILGQLIDRPWFYAGLGVSTPSTAAALALFMLVVPEFMFFVQPLLARYSRKREFEADAYARGYAAPSHLARALVKLYHDNAATLTPDPLHSAFYDSHPPAAMRIARLEAK